MYAGWPCRIHRRCLAASQYLLSDSPGTFYIFASFGCSVLTVDKRRENPDPTWRRERDGRRESKQIKHKETRGKSPDEP